VTVEFEEAARFEFRAAASYYEGCAPGLGSDFTGEVQRVIGRIVASPKMFPIFHNDTAGANASFSICDHLSRTCGCDLDSGGNSLSPETGPLEEPLETSQLTQAPQLVGSQGEGADCRCIAAEN
jgi:hypothetical protein